MTSKHRDNFAVPMSILEEQTDIGNDVTLQVWFHRVGADHIRTEVYQFENGTVVAYQDCVNGTKNPLQMDNMFKALYEGEPAYWTILHYSGVMDPRNVEVYHMGR